MYLASAILKKQVANFKSSSKESEVEKQNKVMKSFKKVFKYPLSEVSLNLANPDGNTGKADKSKL